MPPRGRFDQLRSASALLTDGEFVRLTSSDDLARGVIPNGYALARRAARPIVVSIATRPVVEARPAPEQSETWVEITLVDDDDQPIANARYEAELPGGSTRSGSLDSGGRARLGGLQSRGIVYVRFPDHDVDHSITRE